MSANIKTLKDKDEVNIIYPQTRSNAVFIDDNTSLDTIIALKADVNSPTFTGSPKAPTPVTSDNSTNIATTAFVKTNISEYIPNISWGDINGSIINQVDLQTELNSKQTSGSYATLDNNGKLTSSQIPDSVHDVLSYANYSSLPETGTISVIYICNDTNKLYKWTGSTYSELSPMEIGTTASTAYEGSRGLANETSIATHTSQISTLNSQVSSLNTAVSSKEAISNKVTAISDSSTDTEYSSAKAVYTFLNSEISRILSTEY